MKLLVAVDLLHDDADRVVREAAQWAARLGATLDVAYVDEYEYSAALIRDPSLRAAVAGEWQQLHAKHAADLQALTNTIPEGTRGEARYLTGRAAPVLVEAAAEYDAMVVGTHGRTGLNHVLMGSVAERLVRMVSVPVLVLRLQAAAAPEAR